MATDLGTGWNRCFFRPIRNSTNGCFCIPSDEASPPQAPGCPHSQRWSPHPLQGRWSQLPPGH